MATTDVNLFDLFFAFTLKEEGGFVNDPHDRGGATSGGITQVTYTAYRYRHDMPSQSVRSITLAEIRDIYKSQYFDACSCGLMPEPYPVAVGDTAILCGPGYAVSWLTQALGLPITHQVSAPLFLGLRAKPVAETLDSYIDLRIAHHQRVVLENPDQERFLDGWIARAERLRAHCKGLVGITSAVEEE